MSRPLESTIGIQGSASSYRQLVEFGDERILDTLEDLIEQVGSPGADMATQLLQDARRVLGLSDPAE